LRYEAIAIAIIPQFSRTPIASSTGKLEYLESGRERQTEGRKTDCSGIPLLACRKEGFRAPEAHRPLFADTTRWDSWIRLRSDCLSSTDERPRDLFLSHLLERHTVISQKDSYPHSASCVSALVAPASALGSEIALERIHNQLVLLLATSKTRAQSSSHWIHVSSKPLPFNADIATLNQQIRINSTERC
jgi:hypothetical protein